MQYFFYNNFKLLVLVISIFFHNNLYAQEKSIIEQRDIPISKWTILRDSTSVKVYLDSIFTLYKNKDDIAAIPLFRHALYASIKFNQFSDASDAFSVIITILNNNGMYERSYKEMMDMEIIAQSRMKSLLPIVYNSKANYYKTIGLIDSSLSYYLKAIEYIDKDSTFYHPTALPTIYTNLSGIYSYTEGNENKISHLKKIEKFAQNTDNQYILTLMMINQSVIFKELKNYEKSRLKLNEAIDLARKKQYIQLQYLAYVNVANIDLLEKKYQSALLHLKEASLLEADINPLYKNMWLYRNAQIYFELKDYQKAESYLIKSIQHSLKYKLAQMAIIEQHLLSKLYSETQQFEKALEQHLKYTELKDSLASVEVLKNIQHLEIKHRITEKDKENALHQLKIKEQEAYLRNKNVWIIGISVGALFLTILLASLYRTNKHKRKAQTKQIQFLQQEQEALIQQQKVLKKEKEIDELKAMIQGEEKERSRISRELHDGIGGMLSAINMNLNAVQNLFPEINKIKDIQNISKMLEDTSVEVRKTAHNLMPDVLLRHGLKEALVIYCDQVNTTNELLIDFQCYGNLEVLHKGSQLSIYRIIQELIQNTVKHAEAQKTIIQIMEYEEKLTITVEDDGLGFEKETHTNGYGLKNLEFRVRALKGNISIMSKKGKGTTVFIEFNMASLIMPES